MNNHVISKLEIKKYITSEVIRIAYNSSIFFINIIQIYCKRKWRETWESLLPLK